MLKKNMNDKYFEDFDGSKIYLMQSPVECETAAIATCTQIDYDKVNEAMHRARNLPDIIENPIYGNPITVAYTLLKLGFWKKELTLTEFLNGAAIPNKTMMLVKKSFSKQHWVVFNRYERLSSDNDIEYFYFHWGYDKTPRKIRKDELIEYFTEDGPINTCFIIYKCNVLKMLTERCKLWILRQKNKIKKLFSAK